MELLLRTGTPPEVITAGRATGLPQSAGHSGASRRPELRGTLGPHAYLETTPTPDRESTPQGEGSSATPRHEFTQGLYGWITHTDLASADPAATRTWCAKVLGWTFTMELPMPGGGTVHLFAYSEKGGGAIRPNNPPELPGSIPYVHVADAQAAFDLALRDGAEEMISPTRVMEGVTVAIVRAPGGVPIGFSGP